MKKVFLSFAILSLLGLLLNAADDPAKGHYESALFLLQNQKYQQALDDLNFIVKSFPQSSLADDALLQLGLYYLNQEKKLDQALVYFQQIKDNYTNSNSAPPAYYYLGQINLSKRNSASLDEAFANFERVTRVFPSSTWVDKSLVGAGSALKWRGEYDKAYEQFSGVKIRFADSPLAPQAQYEMGVCSLLGDHYQEAAVDFQQVIDRYPSSDFTRSAREMNTILYRLYVAPASDHKIYSLDPSYTLTTQDMDEPTAMSVDSNQNLLLADKGKKLVWIFDPAARVTKSLTVAAPTSLQIDDLGRIVAANGSNVYVVGADPVPLSYNKDNKQVVLEEIRSVAVNTFGEFFVVSGKTSGILVFDAAHNEETKNPLGKMESEFTKVLVNPKNQIVALDKDRKQIAIFESGGKPVLTLGPTGKGFEFDRIEDFTIDRANHLYVLTKNPKGIFIFSSNGALMKFLASEKKGTLSFEDAKLIAVGPTGSIYVLDKDSKRVLKIG